MDNVDSVLQRLRSENIDVQPLKVVEGQLFTIKRSELASIANTNPQHPKAIVFLKAIQGLPPNEDVYVDRVDLEAVIENRHVEHHTIIETQTADDGSVVNVNVERKSLV